MNDTVQLRKNKEKYDSLHDQVGTVNANPLNIERTHKHMRLLGESVSVNMNVYINYIFKICMLLKGSSATRGCRQVSIVSFKGKNPRAYF